MASFKPAFLFLVILSVFLSASARPCKTLFISSYSFSIKPLFPNPHNPNPTFIAVVTQISTHHSTPQQPPSLFGLSYDASSLRDRSKDILSVVVALLFGVGCGALTAATMYLLWSMFLDRPGYDFFDDVADDKEELKKFGYVKIPDIDPVQATV